MSLLEWHTLNNDCGDHIATVTPAKPEDYLSTLNQRDDDPNGRSQFCWIRLSSGELILGVFPQGDTYELVSQRLRV